MLRRSVLCAAALLTPALAGAAGFYNVPSTACQVFGYGAGPGYHAPLLLSRPVKARVAAKPVRRLPAPMRPSQAPPVAVGFGEMSPLPAAW